MPSGNFLYPWARNKFLTASLNWGGANYYKVMFINGGVEHNIFGPLLAYLVMLGILSTVQTLLEQLLLVRATL